jgi:hypothetical protein
MTTAKAMATGRLLATFASASKSRAGCPAEYAPKAGRRGKPQTPGQHPHGEASQPAAVTQTDNTSERALAGPDRLQQPSSPRIARAFGAIPELFVGLLPPPEIEKLLPAIRLNNHTGRFFSGG